MLCTRTPPWAACLQQQMISSISIYIKFSCFNYTIMPVTLFAYHAYTILWSIAHNEVYNAIQCAA